MREFTDEQGEVWVADAREENTPRHHGRWYLVLHPAGAPEPVLAMPEVRWQTAATAHRTVRTMSEFELRRRLATLRTRAASTGEPRPGAGDRPSTPRDRTTANAD